MTEPAASWQTKATRRMVDGRSCFRARCVYIGSLRKKLEFDPGRPKYILTELGVGYRLVIDTESV